MVVPPHEERRGDLFAMQHVGLEGKLVQRKIRLGPVRDQSKQPMNDAATHKLKHRYGTVFMSWLQAAHPRTVHEPHDTCCKDRSFLETASSNLIGWFDAAFGSQGTRSVFRRNYFSNIQFCVVHDITGFSSLRQLVARKLGILSNCPILLWFRVKSIIQSVLITFRWKDILTAKSTHISNHSFAAVCLTICGDSCAMIRTRYHTNLLLWFRF